MEITIPAALAAAGPLSVIDLSGLSHAELTGAIASGTMPALGRLLGQQHYQLLAWHQELHATAAASQIGIIKGDNFDLPGPIWFDRERGNLRLLSLRRALATTEHERSNVQHPPGLLRWLNLDPTDSLPDDEAIVVYTVIAIPGSSGSSDWFERLDALLAPLVDSRPSSRDLVLLSSSAADDGSLDRRGRGSALADHLERLLPGRALTHIDLGDAGGEVFRPGATLLLTGPRISVISFTDRPTRRTIEEIDAEMPQLIQGLLANLATGLLLVQSRGGGSIAIGRTGTTYLDDDLVQGSDPLAGYGEFAGRHLRRLGLFNNCPDIVIIHPVAGATSGTIHGNRANAPFLLIPEDFLKVDEPIVGACAIHELLCQRRSHTYEEQA